MVKTELEMLDVRHFSARQLRPLLESEAQRWQQRLRWDYRSATELLLQYLDSRILPGFVALDRGRLCGYSFCVYEGRKAVVGDAFALDNAILSGLETTQELLRQLLQVLAYAPDVDRIESQLLLYETGHIAGPFVERSFLLHRRLFMEVDLRAIERFATLPATHLPGYFDLQRWLPADYNSAADLIHAAYTGHIDATINDQYRTVHGSQRFLHNIVRFPGCGAFDPRASWTLRDRRTGALAALVLCSRVRPDTAHITQLCVAPAHRGFGLGAYLLQHVLRDLAASALDAITLTVTEANDSAVRLYRRCHFATRHVFDAHVLDKPAHRHATPGSSIGEMFRVPRG